MSQEQGPNPYNKRKEAGLSLLNQLSLFRSKKSLDNY